VTRRKLAIGFVAASDLGFSADLKARLTKTKAFPVDQPIEEQMLWVRELLDVHASRIEGLRSSTVRIEATTNQRIANETAQRTADAVQVTRRRRLGPV